MGAIDYTKLLSKLLPEPGGEDVLRLRVGVVDAVNLDGTADVAISGVVVPDVPKLSSTALAPGDVVQVLSYRGSLMILGSAGGDGGGWIAGGGLTSPVSATTPESAKITALDINGVTPTYKPGRIYRVVTQASAYCSNITAGQPIFRLRKTNTSGTVFDIWRTSPNDTSPSDATSAAYVSYFKVLTTAVAANIVLTLEAATGTATLQASSDAPASINVYEDGPATSGSRTWIKTLT